MHKDMRKNLNKITDFVSTNENIVEIAISLSQQKLNLLRICGISDETVTGEKAISMRNKPKISYMEEKEK